MSETAQQEQPAIDEVASTQEALAQANELLQGLIEKKFDSEE